MEMRCPSLTHNGEWSRCNGFGRRTVVAELNALGREAAERSITAHMCRVFNVTAVVCDQVPLHLYVRA